MAQDPEKRFHSIMDKLFRAPKSLPNPSSSSGAQSSQGRKRTNPFSALTPVELKKGMNSAEGSQHSSALTGSPQVPLCRPWDRGDLMRRLATFKSMTWFAKPKVVSAVKCATRGWVNVDTDIISCESCGARLLFSTPSSWTQQQVEKAALVFSLKLDNGHKLLCPWIDNACDETLAKFPPTPPEILVQEFNERSSALIRLSALPIISSSAIEYMRSPQLEEFLRQSWTLQHNESAQISQIESLANGSEADSAGVYYQAQKLISLCGWEPRSLPYVVDCKDGEPQFVKDARITKAPHLVAKGQNPSSHIHATATYEIIKINESSGPQNEQQSDPKSIVLDCRLCGAAVGLWAFSMVLQPVELFRLVGYAEVNGENHSGTYGEGSHHIDNAEGVVKSASNGVPSHKESSSTFSLTIAEGPPPTKQNFKATISLPVIGRSLRAKFISDRDFRDITYLNQEHKEEVNHAEHSHSGMNHEELELIERRRHDHVHCSSRNEDKCSSSNQSIQEKVDTPEKGNINTVSSEGNNITREGTIPETYTQDFMTEEPTGSQNFDLGLGQSDRELETAAVFGSARSTAGNVGSSQVRESSLVITPETSDLQHIQGTNVADSEEICLPREQEPSSNTYCLVSNQSAEIPSKPDAREGGTSDDVQNTSSVQADIQEGLRIPVNNEVTYRHEENNQRQSSVDNAMKFDPIRQHRHFCPWIVSMDGSPPGWQRRLSALMRGKEPSHPSPANASPTASIIKVDDPVTSVRKLFMSPPTKRLKPNPGSTSSATKLG